MDGSKKNCFSDAIQKNLYNDTPKGRIARRNISTAEKIINEKLKPIGPVVNVAATGRQVQNARRTGFNNLYEIPTSGFFKFFKPTKFSVSVSNNKAVDQVQRTRKEAKLHVLLESHFKSVDEKMVERAPGPFDGQTIDIADLDHENNHASRLNPFAWLTQSGLGRNRSPDENAPLLNTGHDRFSMGPIAEVQRESATGASSPRIPPPQPEVNIQTPRAQSRVHTATGPHSRNPEYSAAQREVIAFFENRPTIPTDLTISRVLSLNADELESGHDFIQRVFPTDTPSRYNKSAPVLKGIDFLALRENPAVSNGIDAGFKKMLEFYELHWDGKNIRTDLNASAFLDKFDMQRSHNRFRMTRIIRSMALFGKYDEAAALLNFMTTAVSRLPDNSRRDWNPSLQHWKAALNQPVPLSGRGSKQIVYMFPNKLIDDDPATLVADGKMHPRKAEKFNDQATLFKNMGSHNHDAPLKAHFTRAETAEKYANGDHLQAKVGAIIDCKIDFFSSRYFPETPATTSSGQNATSDNVYDVHVDFANRSFGGAWKGLGWAQEEMAFVENAGLGAVAQQAGAFMRRQNAASEVGQVPTVEHKNNQDPRRSFGPTFLTRQETEVRDSVDGTEVRGCRGRPIPLMVENCVRFNNAPGVDVKPAALQPRAPLTNWLAIAAPDLRSYRFLTTPDGSPVSNAKAERIAKSYAESEMVFTDIFATAHAGFSMAKDIAATRPLRMHTGLLGCGVFNNDKAVSIAAQVLAARLTGVDEFKFYCDRDEQETKKIFEKITDIVDRCTADAAKSPQSIDVKDLVRNVYNEVKTLRL